MSFLVPIVDNIINNSTVVATIEGAVVNKKGHNIQSEKERERFDSF